MGGSCNPPQRRLNDTTHGICGSARLPLTAAQGSYAWAALRSRAVLCSEWCL